MSDSPTPTTFAEAINLHLEPLRAAQRDLRRLEHQVPGALSPREATFHRGLQGLADVIGVLNAMDDTPWSHTPSTGIRRDPETGIVTETFK